MNQNLHTNELDFGYKIRHALDEQANHIPEHTLNKLKQARQNAIQHALQPRVSLLSTLRLASANYGLNFSLNFSLFQRFFLVIPAIALVLSLSGLWQNEQQRHIMDTAEIDAALLADELPLNAYLDHGFSAYLATQAEHAAAYDQ